MAKKPKITADSLVTSVIETREKKGGHAYRTTEHRGHTYGIDIPNLGVQWLLGGINKLPLGRVIAFSGEYGSFKSSLAAVFGGWFMTQNGIFVDIDTEGKKSPTTYEALYHRMDEHELSKSILEAAETPEEWQRIFNAWFAKVKSEEVMSLPKGERIPLMVNVDSIIGRATEADQVKLQQEGHAAERGYATINNMIKKFMEGIALVGSTCTISYITHLKDEMADASGGRGMSIKKQKELGGTSPGFYATTIIRTRKGKAMSYVDDDGCTVSGYMVTLSGHKVSTGPNNRKLDVPVLWRHVDDDSPDGFHQEMWFDWDWALGLLLHRMMLSDRYKRSEYPKLVDYLSIMKTGCGSDASPTFQQTQKLNAGSPTISKEKVHIRELGRAIHAEPEIRREIQKQLHINLYPDVQDVTNLDYKKKA